jgi:lysylphosphatidylglycerol synthetase-like protein (DUF2156 family)
MSTIAFGILTTKREKLNSIGMLANGEPPVSKYVDALAALVPAEVLALHAFIIALTTSTEKDVTKIIAKDQLEFAFYVCTALSILMYVLSRMKEWDWKLDVIRALVPAASFVAWTMIQRTTAFDAAFPEMDLIWRSVVAAILAVVLGLVVAQLAKAANENTAAPGEG